MPTLQRLILVLLAILLSVAPSARAQHEDATGGGEGGQGAGGGNGETGEPTQVLIRGDDWQQETAQAWLRDHGFSISAVGEYPVFSIWLYEFDAGTLSDADIATVRQILDSMLLVRVIEDGDFNIPMSVERGVGQTGSLWVSGMTETQFDNQYAFSLIGQAAASDRASGAGAIVAIIDSGLIPGAVRASTYSMNRGYDFVNALGAVQGVPGSDTGDNLDENGINGADEGVGHGTFVASIIGSVAPLARHLHMKVLDDEGTCKLSHVVAALEACYNEDVHVVNMSLVPSQPTSTLRYCIGQARLNGSIVIASAGNSGQTVNPFMGSEADLIQVGATDWANAVWASSPTNSAWVDVMAPGVSNISTASGTANPTTVASQSIIGEFRRNGSTPIFAAASGTSFSAAFVAGSAAAFRSANPDWPNPMMQAGQIAGEFRTRMLSSGANVSVPNVGTFKRLNALALVQQFPHVPRCADDVVPHVVGEINNCCRNLADQNMLLSQKNTNGGYSTDRRRILRGDLDRNRRVDLADEAILNQASSCP